MTPSHARRFLAVLDPIATASMFAAETFEECAKLGLQAWAVYFCTRTAPMGRVPAEVAIATFYNFNPDMVRRELRWDIASPEDVWAARVVGAQRCMERVLGDDAPKVDRAADLLREAAAACPLQGRPLFAGHAAMPWPKDPLTALWHGATLLREFRGDGHISVLVSHGVGPIEAIVLNGAWIEADIGKYAATREWREEHWRPAIDRLVERGFMTSDGVPTDGGWKFREMIEMDTDRIAAAPWNALGSDKCEEALSILEPIAKRFLETKAVPSTVGRTARTVRLG